jgi:hypothetical protein
MTVDPSDTEPRKGSPSPRLDETEFRRRFRSQFSDPAFEAVGDAMEKVVGAAWDAYSHHRKSPHVRKAGGAFYDPGYDLAVDWLEARDRVLAAQAMHDDPGGTTRLLLVSSSSRSEHTCPGELSKSYRLAQIAREAILSNGAGVEVEVLDLSRVASEYGGISTHARLASRRLRLCVIGRVPAIPTTRSARRKIG